jgi:predicted RND superfamily exporter protein
MQKGLVGLVQTYAAQIVVIVIVITILFMGALPSIKVLTNWEDFNPDNEVTRNLNKVNNNFGRSSKYHYVYVTGLDSEDMLSPSALREQFNITLEAKGVFGVEDVVGVSGFINDGWRFVFNKTGDENILNATDAEIELVKSIAVSIYKANFTGDLPIDISLEEVQELMATLLPSDFDPEDPKADSTLILVMIFGRYNEPRFKKISLNIKDTVNNMDFKHVKVHQTSNALLTNDVDQSVWNTTITLGIAVFILIVILLAFSFRDYTYVLLPIFTLVIVAIWTFGTMVFLGIEFTVVEVAVLPLVVGLGIDYSVHISRRYQEELRKNKDVSLALSNSVRKVGSALSLAVFTTIIAFFSNIFSEIGPIRNFGILVGLGIFYAFFLTLTFHVALRFLFDSRRGARILGTNKENKQVLDRGMRFGALTVKKFSVPILLVVIVLTALGGFFAMGVETEFSLEDFVPQQWPTMRTTNLIRNDFVSASFSQEYIFLEGNITEPEVIQNIGLMETNIQDDTHVVKVEFQNEERLRVDSIRKYMAEAISKNATLGVLFKLTPQGLPDSGCARDDIDGMFTYLCTNSTYQEKVKSVLYINDGEFEATVIRVFVTADKTDDARRVHNELKEDIVDTPGVLEKITGETILVITTIDSFQRSQVLATAFSVIISALVLMMVYRNAILGLIAVVPVAISTIWILGTMFVLGISINVFTVMVTALTIGLGIDYSIHIIQRFREERKTQSPKKSMQITIEQTGSAIFISAITTIVGFAVLLLSPMPLTQHFGVITAATIVYSFDLAVFVLPILLVAWALTIEKRKGN